MVLTLSGLIGLGYAAIWVLPLQQWIERFPKLELLSQARVYWANIPLLAKSVGLSLVVHMLMVMVHLMVADADAF